VYDRLGPEFANRLIQVVDERIVVVEDEDLHARAEIDSPGENPGPRLSIAVGAPSGVPTPYPSAGVLRTYVFRVQYGLKPSFRWKPSRESGTCVIPTRYPAARATRRGTSVIAAPMPCFRKSGTMVT